MAGDAAARLAQQQLAEGVALALERPHLLEHGRARRREHSADDDVADLAAGVAADDRDHPPRAHGATLSRYSSSSSSSLVTVFQFRAVVTTPSRLSSSSFAAGERWTPSGYQA